MLEETWRLSRLLAAWPSATFYRNRLICRHDQRLALSPPPDDPALLADPALFLIETGETGTSVRSHEESQHVVHLVRETIRGGVAAGRIGVITPFRAQARRIRHLLMNREVVVDTVDRFQGQERDVMFYSLAASDPVFVVRRADFIFQRERINVAVTRARLKTVLLASRELIRESATLADAGHEGAACFASLVAHLRRTWPD